MSHENGNNHTPDSQQIVPAAASELNNLIQIISDTVTMLQNIWEGPPDSQRYFEMLRKSVDRAAKVTAQLVQHMGGTEKKILMHPALPDHPCMCRAAFWWSTTTSIRRKAWR